MRRIFFTAGSLVLLLLVGVFYLSGCSTMKVEQFAATKPELRLEEYFAGRTTGVGILFGRNGDVKRQFSVSMLGTWDGTILTLEEDFVFSDGEKQHRTWKVRKLDQHNYEGEAGDVVGKAVGKQYGAVTNWAYVLRLKVDGAEYDIKFDDWLFLTEDGTLLNRATMSKFGFTVGELFLSFRKVG